MSTGQPIPPDPAHLELAARPGPLAWFAHNHVAANLLMLLLLIGGVASLQGMRREVFPKVDTGRITVSVNYPGASPADVETGVCSPIEEALTGVEGIKRIRSTAQEGVGSVVAELEDFAETRTVQSDMEAAVDRIETFPEEIEDPVISEVSNRVQVISVVVFGNVSERALKTQAEQIRNELTALGDISQIETSGVRPYEISVEISDRTLRKFGLTLEQVAGLVRRSSQDRPGGSVKTPEGEILLRGKSQRYRGPDFEDIIVASHVDGTTRRLSEVATVRDTFRDIDTSTLFDGKPAAILKVFRVGEQDAINVAETVKAYIERKRPELPAGIELDTWFDRSNFLQDRIDLLKKNALIGLVLVFICLMLFLDLRLAFWTTLGIPISFMGAICLLPLFDVSINMISLFAFIVVLGIVVDDAIVVGENIFEYRRRGLSRVQAAVCGVREMAVPVTFAILTTVVAFGPLMFTAGEMGKIMFVIPIVVVTVLLISLVEALLILPAHLTGQRLAGSPGPLARLQARTQAALDRFVRGHYTRMLHRAIQYRYVTVSVALAMLLVTLGLIVGGHIRWVFFEDMDADNVVVGLVMPQGTPVSETTRVVARLEASMEEVKGELEKIHGPIFKHTSTTIGDQPFAALVRGQEMRGRAGVPEGSGHLAEVNLELVSGEDRDITAKKIARLWREATGDIAGVSSLTFRAIFFSPGEAVNVELAHQDFEKLLHASDKVREALVGYGGVSDVADSFEPGKREVKIVLTDAGRTLGLTQDDLDRQVRGAFYGAEAERIQRGRDDMKVMVRFPESERRSLEDLERMRIALPDGNRAAFAAVARVAFGRGYAQIDRVDRRRVVSVTADVDESQVTANQVNRNLREKVLPRVAQAMPGLTYSFEGEQKEQRESLLSLVGNFVIAMFMIYGLLGVQFKSYLQPLIIMSAIPFGLIGAVIGHVIFGMDLSFLSGFGVVALTGVVVNDSLIMIDLINRLRSEGMPLEQVLMQSGVRRFRPIMLTTLTTFCGLTPMLLEQSLQARFLVPMAVSLAFGVLFATMITLLLVPTLYRILEDAHQFWRGTADPVACPTPTPALES